MHFIDLIKKISIDEEVILFVDMDGVIASYDVGRPYDFKNKRPLKNNINIFREIAKLDRVSLHILSVCRENYQIEEKNEWLDINAPFFEKENRVILSKEDSIYKISSELKLDYLKNYKTDKKIVFIDDDNSVLSVVNKELKNIILFQDSELVD